MDVSQVIAKVNKSVEELDFVTTRRYLEENIELLQEHKTLLKKNARDLLAFLIEYQDSGVQPLQRKDMAVINSINVYASKFDIRGLKFVIKENPRLLLKKEIIPYLNSDARILLESMGAIAKSIPQK